MIQKNYKDGETYFREMIGANLYEMREPRKIIWKYSNETQQYNNYKVKKQLPLLLGDNGKRGFQMNSLSMMDRINLRDCQV